MKKVTCDKSQGKNHALHPYVFRKMRAGHHDQKTYEQCEKYILHFPVYESSIDSQVKGNLRNQGKKKKPDGIFSGIPGMQEAFDQKETEDREGGAADGAQDVIENGKPVMQDRAKRCKRRTEQSIFQHGGSDMVDEHAYDRDQFQGAAGKAVPCFFTAGAGGCVHSRVFLSGIMICRFCICGLRLRNI